MEVDLPPDARVSVPADHYRELSTERDQLQERMNRIAEIHGYLGSFMEQLRREFGNDFTRMVGQFNEIDAPVEIVLGDDNNVTVRYGPEANQG